jgi:hypothetical protein
MNKQKVIKLILLLYGISLNGDDLKDINTLIPNLRNKSDSEIYKLIFEWLQQRPGHGHNSVQTFDVNENSDKFSELKDALGI